MHIAENIPYERGDITSAEELRRACVEARFKHPTGCYGMWTLAVGKMKARCQGCGFTMRINPVGNLEYIQDIYEAMEEFTTAVTFISNQQHAEGCPCDLCQFAREQRKLRSQTT